MLRVLIVDDEPLARENLRVLLQEQSDIEVVGECANAIEGIGAVHKLRPRTCCSSIFDAAHQRAGDGRHARPGAPSLYRLSDGL